MGEETTKNFENEESFETRVLSELAALRNSMENRFGALENRFESLETRFATESHSANSRLTLIEGRLSSVEVKVEALAEKVDARLRETRPIWEAVLTRLDIIESRMEGLALGWLDVRGEVQQLKRRLPPLPPAA